ncbi:Putative zinc finger protein CONSTANS-LIKE 11 [Morus notabilis]|uniref:Putative zinc finger protein CONSTANS-LIKE 11 n=1 Tax=Morus notabilis TaxID=981085 RepID=W9S317_9ROSA|nr:Putative zinc finger protein CONSTANS-LIKE 11 [Morus notabilis]
MKKCELCDSQAKMYCESDRASLCWDCDARVHGANFLVAKHSRTLLCRVCQSPTPWNGSGPKLSPTVSVCESCVNGCYDNQSRNDEDQDHEDGGDDEDAHREDRNIDEEDEDDDNSSDDDDGMDEEDEENQVVPWSNPPPTTPGSSRNEECSKHNRFFTSQASVSDSDTAFSWRIGKQLGSLRLNMDPSQDIQKLRIQKIAFDGKF